MSVQLQERVEQIQSTATNGIVTNGHSPIPPLESGDRLSRVEFERRYHLHPKIKKAELDDYLQGSPELIVEVAASSASYDMNNMPCTSKVYKKNNYSPLPTPPLRREGTVADATVPPPVWGRLGGGGFVVAKSTKKIAL